MNYEDKIKEVFGDMDIDFLEPYEEEALLVIENQCLNEKVRYRGNSELEAFKKYKAISHNNKCVIKAKVVLTAVGSIPMIIEYEEIEKIK